MKSTLFILAVMSSVSVYSDDERSFERYRPIIDRQMFGRLPADFDPAKPPNEVTKSGKAEKEISKEQERVKSSVHFSMIDQPPGGETVVGFSDNSDPKTPKHYRLKVGESCDGWTVVEADAKLEKMKIVKDDIEVELKLGGNSAKDDKSTSRAGEPKTLELRPASAHGGLLRSPSLQSRRLLRRKQEEEERIRRENEKKKAEESRLEIQEQLLQLKEETLKAREMADKAAAAAEARDKEQNDAENNAEPVQE